MSDVPKIGQVCPRNASYKGRKDAFHVPGVLTQSREDIVPGTFVRFRHRDVAESVVACDLVDEVADRSPHGVVDPFAPGPIKAGEMFWVLLMPGLVQNLQHVFDITGLSDTSADEYDECKGCY